MKAIGRRLCMLGICFVFILFQQKILVKAQSTAEQESTTDVTAYVQFNEEDEDTDTKPDEKQVPVTPKGDPDTQKGWRLIKVKTGDRTMMLGWIILTAGAGTSIWIYRKKKNSKKYMPGGEL